MPSPRTRGERCLYLCPANSPEVGLGHVRRSLAIADAAPAYGLNVRLMADRFHPHGTRQSPKPEASLSSGAWIETVRRGDFVVFDDYGIDQDVLSAVSARGALVAALDDRAVIDLEVDLLIVPSQLIVEAPRAHKVLSGPAFAPVSGACRRARRPDRPGTDRLLVTMGGGDIGGMTIPIVEALAGRSPFRTLRALIGPLAGSHDVTTARSLPGVEVTQSVDDPSTLFAESNAAISSAGSTIWELLCIGVPTALVITAGNQQGVAKITRAADAVLSLPTGDVGGQDFVDVVSLLADPQVQQSLHEAGQELVDGHGAERICRALVGTYG